MFQIKINANQEKQVKIIIWPMTHRLHLQEKIWQLDNAQNTSNFKYLKIAPCICSKKLMNTCKKVQASIFDIVKYSVNFKSFCNLNCTVILKWPN